MLYGSRGNLQLCIHFQLHEFLEMKRMYMDPDSGQHIVYM